MYLRQHALLVGDQVAVLVQDLYIGLGAAPAVDVHTAPVLLQLVVRLVQIIEVRLDDLGLGVVERGGNVVHRHRLIERNHYPLLVVVALQLQRLVPCTEQFPGVPDGVAQRLAYQCRALMVADGVSYRVLAAGVQHNHDGLAVVVGGFLVSPCLTVHLFVHRLPLLVDQFHVPSVQCPIGHGGLRSLALVLHLKGVPQDSGTALVPQGGGLHHLPVSVHRDRTLDFRFPQYGGYLVILFHDLCVIQVHMLGKQLVHDRLVLLVPYQGGGRVALVLVHQSDEAFRFILVHFTLERLSRRRKFVGIAGVAFAVPHFQQIVHHLTQPVPYVETGSATSETAFRIAVAQPDDCIQDTCLERIERDFLRSERLSRTVPVGGEEGVGGLVVPYSPLKRTGGGTFDILMGITVIFDV